MYLHLYKLKCRDGTVWRDTFGADHYGATISARLLWRDNSDATSLARPIQPDSFGAYNFRLVLRRRWLVSALILFGIPFSSFAILNYQLSVQCRIRVLGLKFLDVSFICAKI